MTTKIPNHVAIIMDGNGRWAKARGFPRSEGHRQGAKAFEKIAKYAQKCGVKVMTVFAFSSENWNRPTEEVGTLVGLLRDYLNSNINELKKEKVRLTFIGDRMKFPPDMVQKMTELEKETEGYTHYRLVFALSYGGRDDIVSACKKIASQAAKGFVKPEDIDAKMVASGLSTNGIPEPDLVIRTSGEERVSNFLLWELAYAELYFAPEMWPAFDEKAFDRAMDVYAKRERRYGKV